MDIYLSTMSAELLGLSLLFLCRNSEIAILVAVYQRDRRTCNERTERQHTHTGCDYEGAVGEIKNNWIGIPFYLVALIDVSTNICCFNNI